MVPPPTPAATARPRPPATNVQASIHCAVDKCSLSVGPSGMSSSRTGISRFRSLTARSTSLATCGEPFVAGGKQHHARAGRFNAAQDRLAVVRTRRDVAGSNPRSQTSRFEQFAQSQRRRLSGAGVTEKHVPADGGGPRGSECGSRNRHRSGGHTERSPPDDAGSPANCRRSSPRIERRRIPVGRPTLESAFRQIRSNSRGTLSRLAEADAFRRWPLVSRSASCVSP